MKRHITILTVFLIACSAGLAFNRNEVKEDKSELISDTFNKETGQRTLVQGWAIDPDHAPEAIEYLERYASTKNVAANRYITKPEGKIGQKFDGTYILGSVYYNYEAGMVLRSLHSVQTVTNVTLLAAVPHPDSRENQILEPFNFKTGEGDRMALVWRGLHPNSQTWCTETLSDAALVSNFAPNWTYVDRSWQHDEAGAGVFAVAFQMVEWNTWATNAYDYISYQDKDRDGEQRTKTWENYRIADMAAMTTYLGDDTNADTNFHITAVSVANNRNGSIHVSQSSIRQVAESSLDGALTTLTTLDPFGLEQGTQSVTKAVYAHFTTNELAGLSETVPAGYTLISQETDIEPSGLFTRTYVYGKVTWRSWTNTLAHDKISYVNPERPREGQTMTWVGIDNADILTAAEALATGGVSVASGYYVKSVSVSERSDGAFDASRTIVKQLTNTAVTATELLNPNSLCEGSVARTTITYDGYASTNEVPNPPNYVPGVDTGVIANGITGPDADGLFGRTIITESTSWGEWRSETKDSYDYYAVSNPDRDGEQWGKVWCGIDNGDLADAMDDLKTSTNFAETGYAVASVSVRDNQDGSITLSQDLLKQIDERAGANGTGRLSGTTIIGPHSLQSGTNQTFRSEYRNFTDTDLAAISETGPNGYILVDDQTAIQPNGLFSRVFSYEKVSWRSWTNSLSADLTRYSNPSGDRQSISKTWFGIQLSDIDDASSACATGGVAAASGYVIVSVSASPGDAGSFNITQVQAQSVSNASTAQAALISPHSLQPGTISTTTILYDSWPSSTLPNPSAYAIDNTNGNYVIQNEVSGPDASGLYSRTITLQAVSWRTWSTGLGPDTTEPTGSNGDRTQLSHTWYGIRLIDLDDAINDCASGPPGPTAGYYIAGVGVSPSANGSFDISQTERQIVNGKQTTQNASINPLSLCEGTRTDTTIQYDGYSSTNIPGGAYAPGVSNVIANVISGPDTAGLYSRTVTMATTTWGAWSNQTVNSYTFIFRRSKDAPNEQRTKVWCGIRQSDYTNALTALWETNFVDDGFAVIDVSGSDNGNGSVALTQVQVSIGISNAVTTRTITPFETNDIVTTQNATNPVPHETDSTTGVVMTTRAALNASGLYDNTTTTRSQVQGVLAGTNTSATAFRTSIGGTIRGATTVPDASYDTNTYTTTSGTKDEFGRYTLKSDTVTLIPVTNAVIARSRTPFETVESFTHRSLTSTNGYGATYGLGTNVAVTVRKTDAKSFDITVATRKASTDEMGGAGSNLTEHVISRSVAVQNATTSPSITNVTGTTASTSYRLNQFGLYDYTASTNYQQSTSNAYTASRTEFGGRSVVKMTGQSTMGQPDTISGTNKASSVSGQINEYGLYDYTKSTDWAKDNDSISDGSFQWTVQGPGKYWVATVINGGGLTNALVSLTWYYESWDHNVTLYDTQIDAWEARDSEDHDPPKISMSVGSFASGIYYYHTVQRGSEDAPVPTVSLGE